MSAIIQAIAKDIQSLTTNKCSSCLVEDKNNIHWVSIQDLPDSNHKLLDPKTTQIEALVKIKKVLTDELRVDEGDPYDSTNTKVQVANVWYYDGTPISVDEIVYGNSLPLYDTLHNAWATHESVVLSPDDIWIAVQLQFSRYMSKYFEELRTKFVSFEGKKTLEVVMDDAPTNYPLFMERVIELMDGKDDQKVKMADKLVPNFTSSTAFDFSMKNLAVMENMKHYYDYKMSLCCGIEKVGLLGTIEDWIKLREFVSDLKSYDITKDISHNRTLSTWLDEVVIICDGFIETYQGANGEKIKTFWNSMLAQRETHGSGGTTYFKGWLVSLVDYKLSPTIDNDVNYLSSIYFNVPVEHNNNGVKTKINIVGGYTGTLYNKKNKVWRLHRSYVFAESNMVEKEKKISNAEH